MAGVRDPQFWKRFSVAVHMDEEHGEQKTDVKHRYIHDSLCCLPPKAHSTNAISSDSWLATQQRKKSKRTWVCWGFWLLFAAIVAGAVIAVIWLLQSGVLDKVEIGNGEGTPSQQLDPNGNVDVTPQD